MRVAVESLNAVADARGVGIAWRYLDEMLVLDALQRRTAGPAEFDFCEVRDKKGLKAAIKERDQLLKPL